MQVSNNITVRNFSDSNMADEPPISKTMRYKKITKPLLERKRRARMNACLDELKDIMTSALQAEGENVSKLEKADILELTVRHLHKLNQAQRLGLRSPVEEMQKFQAGYSSCAQEATSFLMSTPGLDMRVGHRLLGHLFNPSLAGPPAPPGALTAPQTAPLSSSGSLAPKSQPPPCSSTSSSSSGSLQPQHPRLQPPGMILPPQMSAGFPDVKPLVGMLQQARGMPGFNPSSSMSSMPFRHLASLPDIKPTISQLPPPPGSSSKQDYPPASMAGTIVSSSTPDVKPSLSELEKMRIFRPEAVRPTQGREKGCRVWKPYS